MLQVFFVVNITFKVDIIVLTDEEIVMPLPFYFEQEIATAQLGSELTNRIISELNKDMKLGIETMILEIIKKDLINDIEIVL